MKVLAVTSHSILDAKWMNLSVKMFSPRELLCLLIGGICLISAVLGKVHPALGLFGLGMIVFGFMPFGFLNTEKKIIAFVRFHSRNSHTQKKSNDKNMSEMTGIGDKAGDEVVSEELTESESAEQSKYETVLIEDLESPYTLELKTSIRKQFVPVSVFFSHDDESDDSKDICVSKTVTGRKGKVTCTVLLDKLGTKHVQVIADDDDDDDARNIIYDKMVAFEQK